MRMLNKENIFKNQVDTIEQFKVLAYLKKAFNTDEISLYLVDRFTIKLVDKNNEVGYFKYNSKTKSVDFYEKNIKNGEREMKMKLNYIKAEEYFLPNLIVTEPKGDINKYGYLRLNYLKNYKKALYIELLLKDKLTNHLISVSIKAINKVNFLIENYKKIDKLTEKNKDNNQLEWVKMMNNYKNMAEEIVLNELIYN